MTTWRLALSCVVLAFFANGCSIGDLPFRCAEDSECVYRGETGTCETSGWCSFADQACESHRRYGSQAPDKYADQCVPQCVKQLALGAQHSCALRVDGRLFCWGAATEGELGNGLTAQSSYPDPVEVTVVGAASAVAAGVQHTCAINAETGNVWCWGLNKAFQIGSKDKNDAGPVELIPTLHSKDKPSTSITAGVAHSCSLGSYGVECWGSNGSGQLGTLLKVGESPIPLKALGAAQEVEAGGAHTCARPVVGRVSCWGSNSNGQVDPATAGGANVLTPQDTGHPANALTLGGLHTCIEDNGKVRCWGSDQLLQLGKASSGSGPIDVPLPLDATDVCAGGAHSCALLSDGSAMCWGNDQFGQLGPSIDPLSFTTPVAVKLSRPIKELRCGGKHTCARTDDDRIWCWGDNELGELGNGESGATAPHPTPDSSVTAKLCR